MKVAIIDDNSYFREKIREILTLLIKSYSIQSCSISTYSSVKEIIENKKIFDVIFLDIELNKENGIEASQIIRQYDKEVQFIFVSNYKQYVFKSFLVNPYTYILKDELETEGIKEIKRFLQDYQNNNQVISFNYNKQILTLPQKNILYIEKLTNKCIIHSHLKVYEVYMSLKELLSQCDDNFTMINRSEVVNMRHVQDIKGDQIYIEETILYISRRKKAEVTHCWLTMLGGILS